MMCLPFNRSPLLGGAVALFGLALMALFNPVQAQSVTLTNLRYDIGVMQISVPRLDVGGTTLSESQLRAIFEGSAPGDAMQRLTQLNAATATIPEVIVTFTADGNSQRTVYRDITLNDIAAGVIGRMRAASVAGEMVDKAAGQMRFGIGETLGEGIDLPLIAQVISGSVADPDAVPLRPIYRLVSYRDYVMGLPGGAGEVTIRSVVGRDSRARPGREPLDATLRAVMAMAEKNDANGGAPATPDQADMQVIARLLAFFNNFEYGVIDVEGIAARFKADTSAGSFSIARVRYSDRAQAAGAAMSDLRFEAGPVKLALAEFEMRDFSIAESFRSAAAMLEAGDLTAFMNEWPKLIPKLGTIRLRGFAVEGPNTSAPPRPGPPEIIRASLGSFELGVASQLNGVPTSLKFAGENLAIPLPASSTDQGVRDLLAMGIRNIDLSWLADLGWRESERQLDIRALNVSGRDLFSTAISGQLGNVGPEAFAPDTALAQVAWLSATAQRLTLNLQDSGLLEKVIANEARKARKTPEALRREWGTLAAIGIPAILGDSDGAKALSGAIARFLARPGRLDIDVRSREPRGLGAADVVAAMGQPQAIFNKLEVQASAR